MNKIRILLVGLAAISASSLCMSIAAAPPPPVAEKVISFDAPAPAVSLELAVCDFSALKVSVDIERETVNYASLQQRAAGRTTPLHAKVSAHGRTCRLNANAASPVIKPSTEYEQRM